MCVPLRFSYMEHVLHSRGGLGGSGQRKGIREVASNCSVLRATFGLTLRSYRFVANSLTVC